MTAIRNADEFLSGAGLQAAADDACQDTASQSTPATTFSKPWRGAEYEAEKTALFEYVRNNPEGVHIRQAAEVAFGSAGDTEARTAKRFFERYPEIFETYSMGSLPWVSPRFDLYEGLNLRLQSIHRKTTGRRGDGEVDSDETGENDTAPTGGVQFAKDRAQSYLENYLQHNADSVKESLLRAMVDDIEGSEDLWLGFENNLLDRYKWLPYNTRHNNGGKAGKVRDGFEAALSTATERYNRATVATLTTDPKQHSGLSDALQSLSENKNKLLSWFSTEYQLGYRPEYVCVLEFTQSGLPHLHLVLFGISYAVSQEQLAAKWGDYGQGWVVHIKEVENVHDGDIWRLHDDGDIVALRDYIGKSIRGLQSVANSSADDLRSRLEQGDLSLWRQALYWATERQYFTCSQSLKPPGDDCDTEADETPEPIASQVGWEFIGARQYDDIPATVRRKSTFCGRPPPTTSDNPAGTAVG